MKTLEYLFYLFKKTFKEDFSEFVWHVFMPVLTTFFLIVSIIDDAVILPSVNISDLLYRIFWVLFICGFFLALEAIVLCKRYMHDEDVLQKAIEIYYPADTKKTVQKDSDETEKVSDNDAKGEE